MKFVFIAILLASSTLAGEPHSSDGGSKNQIEEARERYELNRKKYELRAAMKDFLPSIMREFVKRLNEVTSGSYIGRLFPAEHHQRLVRQIVRNQGFRNLVSRYSSYTFDEEVCPDDHQGCYRNGKINLELERLMVMYRRNQLTEHFIVSLAFHEGAHKVTTPAQHDTLNEITALVGEIYQPRKFSFWKTFSPHGVYGYQKLPANLGRIKSVLANPPKKYFGPIHFYRHQGKFGKAIQEYLNNRQCNLRYEYKYAQLSEDERVRSYPTLLGGCFNELRIVAIDYKNGDARVTFADRDATWPVVFRNAPSPFDI